MAEDLSAVHNLQKELEDEQHRSYLMIESAPFGCIVFDYEFNPISCNAVCVDLFQEESKASLLSNLTKYLFEGICDIKQCDFYFTMRDTLYSQGSFQLSATHKTAEGGYFETSMTLCLIHYRGEDQIVAYLEDMREQRRVLDMYAALAYEASLDKLTGVKNRGHFDSKLRVLMTDHKGSEKPLYLVLMDIDDFKIINDTYGHVVGDEVLRSLGEVLCNNIRPIDLVARYGGEEFAVLFENMSLSAITRRVESLRKTIEDMTVLYQSSCLSLNLNITVSLGLAQFNPAVMRDSRDFCDYADRALYQAKHEGKNCFRLYCD